MDLVEIITWYLVFVFSVTLHEAAHAWTAKQGGDLTAYLGGQVTLDPIPHIRRSPVGMVLLPLFTLFLVGWPVGFASAPYNPQWAAHHPKRAAIMSLAGPAANLLLLLVAGVVLRIGIGVGWFLPPSPDALSYGTLALGASGGLLDGLALLFSVMFSLNLILALLNLIPFPPLDGSGVLLFWMGHEATLRYQRFAAGFSFIGLLLAWRVLSFALPWCFRIAFKLLYPAGI